MKGLSWWGFADMGSNGVKVCITLLKNVVLAIATCIFVIVGALMGSISGAIHGQTSEAGSLHGAGIGAVSGAVVAVELLDSLIDGHFKSKIALLGTLLINGEVFREWVNPALLKSFQWQTSIFDVNYDDVSDIFDINEIKGVSLEFINDKLPKFEFSYHDHVTEADRHGTICCTICLEKFKEGECARKLTNCRHFFHLVCVDAWLVKNGSCPICRQKVWKKDKPLCTY